MAYFIVFPGLIISQSEIWIRIMLFTLISLPWLVFLRVRLIFVHSSVIMVANSLFSRTENETITVLNQYVNWNGIA